MPDVEGRTQTEAEAELKRVGVTDIRTDKKENLKPAGTVLKQVPSAGSIVTGSVNLVIAEAISPMPDFKGKMLVEAKTWFEDRGVRVNVEKVINETRPEGETLESIPKPLQPVSAEVILKVAAKPITRQLGTMETVEEGGSFGSPNNSSYLQRGDIGVGGQTLQNSRWFKSFDYTSTAGQAAFWDFNLQKGWTEFRATIGIDDTSQTSVQARFEVFLDGASTAIANKTLGFNQTEDVRIDVTNVLRLRLRATNVSGGKANIVWGSPRLIGSPDKVPETTTTTAKK